MRPKLHHRIKRKVKRRPVRLGGLIVGLLMFLATRYLGKEHADALHQWFVLIAPVIAAFVTERFTFSRDFVLWMTDNFSENGIRSLGAIVEEDDRLNDRGASDVAVAIIVLAIVLVILLLSRGRF